MSEHEHHHDPIEDNIETHPIKLAIGVVIGAAALIVGIVLLAQFAVGSHGSRSMQDDPAMSEAQVAKRLAPAAQLVVDPSDNYFWLSCKTATASLNADRAVPVETRRLLQIHACLHR